MQTINLHPASPTPLSPNGSEWSGYSQYQNTHAPPSPAFPPVRGNLATPPGSGSSTHGINGLNSHAPPRVSSAANGPGMRRGGTSPPASIGGRSSFGTQNSDGPRRINPQMEERLHHHYGVLRRFLGQSVRDEKGNLQPNRARDKLLRLTPIQFQELSTDVYDELLRRQSLQGQQQQQQRSSPAPVPAHLLPRENFHPKRNQARQKLATLPHGRFRFLATDALYELERRFPQFTGKDVSRTASPLSPGPPSRAGTPNGLRPGPPGPMNQNNRNLSSPGAVPGSFEDQYGRPAAKQFQSNTIIPSKSTMVEDNDDDGLSDIYGDRRDTSYTAPSHGSSDHGRKGDAEYDTRVADLQERLKKLEDTIQEKEDHVQKAQQDREDLSARYEKHMSLYSELEAKLQNAQSLNENLELELGKIRRDQASSERELRDQIDSLTDRAAGDGGWRERYEEVKRTNEALRREVSQLDSLTEEVKRDALDSLDELRELSQQTTDSLMREEGMTSRIVQLEEELESWKRRYAQAKSGVRQGEWGHESAGSALLSNVSGIDAITRDESLTSRGGLVQHADIVSFHLAIEELLQTSRRKSPSDVLARVKGIIVAVRPFVLVSEQAISEKSGSKDGKTIEQLKTRISSTANNLITACRNFAASQGLTPVSLVDAAASHLSLSIVAFIKLVKIRADSAPNGAVNGHAPTTNGHTRQIEHPAEDDSLDSSPEITPQLEQRTFSPVASRPSEFNPPMLERARAPSPVSGLPSTSSAATSAAISAEYAGLRGSLDDLSSFLDSRTTALLSTLQSLVSDIRTSAPSSGILDTVQSITTTTGQIVSQVQKVVAPTCEAAMIAQKLLDLQHRLEDKGREGEMVEGTETWPTFVKQLPPLGFEIARQVKEVGIWVETGLKLPR